MPVRRSFRAHDFCIALTASAILFSLVGWYRARVVRATENAENRAELDVLSARTLPLPRGSGARAFEPVIKTSVEDRPKT